MNSCRCDEVGIREGTCNCCIGRYRNTGFDGFGRMYVEPARLWLHDPSHLVANTDKDPRRVTYLAGLLPLDHVWDGPILIENLDRMVMRADGEPALGRF